MKYFYIVNPGHDDRTSQTELQRRDDDVLE